jgi:hypothetical protein
MVPAMIGFSDDQRTAATYAVGQIGEEAVWVLLEMLGK